MTKHLIYFRDMDGDHLVCVEVADELWDDATPETTAADLDAALRLAIADIVRPAMPDESRRGID